MRRILSFLFALAISLVAMANSYFYIDSVVVQPDQWGTVLRVPIKAHFDARVQEASIYLSYSTELTLDHYEYGRDLSVNYLDENGIEQTALPTIDIDNDFTNVYLKFYGQNGYWDPEGTGHYQSYGSVKWEAGDYEEMFVLYLRLPDEFLGADVFVATEVYSSDDARGGTVKDIGQQGQSTAQDCYFVQPKTDPPVVNFAEEGDTLTVTVTGEGMLNVNWWDINDTIYSYKVERQYEPQLIEVWAYAQAYGKEQSDEVYASYEFAAKEWPVADPPFLLWEYNDTTVKISLQGVGGKMFVGDQQMPNPFYVQRTDRDSLITVWSYAQSTYTLPSDTVVNEITIPALGAEITEPPTMHTFIHDDHYTFTAMGKGEVKLYVNRVEVENGYDFQRPGPREPDVVVLLSATAQEEGKLISSRRYWAQWVSHQTLFYDFVEDSIYYLITGEDMVVVNRKDATQGHYSGDVVIPDYVTHDGVTYMVTGIHETAFSQCKELKSVKIGSNVTSIGYMAFIRCDSLAEVTMGDYVIDIDDFAFYECTSLKSITLGCGVATIGREAFKFDNALVDVVCKSATPPVVEEPGNCFSTLGTATLHVHPSVLKRYQEAECWKDFSSIVGESFVHPAPGDVNGDGNISIGDVTRLIDMLLGGAKR